MKEPIEHIGLNLDLIQLPRRIELGNYDWFDIEQNGIQVGKTRCNIKENQFTVFSIMIYPEFQKQGFARTVIDFFKTKHPIIYADRVRFNARDFWTKMKFTEEDTDLFVWRQSLHEAKPPNTD